MNLNFRNTVLAFCISIAGSANAYTITANSVQYSDGNGYSGNATVGSLSENGLPGIASPGNISWDFSAPAAGSATLNFELAGYRSLDGSYNCCSDIFSLFVNGNEILQGAYNLGGGGENLTWFNSNGANVSVTTFGASDDPHNSNQVTWSGGIADISDIIFLNAGLNTITFAYSGANQGTGDESWGINSAEVFADAKTPEPLTFGLICIGFLGMGVILRKNRIQISN
jgi:hypothetical protein